MLSLEGNWSEGFPQVTATTIRRNSQKTKKVFVGDNITLHCDADGKGENEILWTAYYVPLNKQSVKFRPTLRGFDEKRFDYSISEDNTTLKLLNLRKAADYDIICFIANEVGIVEAVKYYIPYTRAIPTPPSKFFVFLVCILCWFVGHREKCCVLFCFVLFCFVFFFFFLQLTQ